MKKDFFYNDLERYNIELAKLLKNPSRFISLPKDWHIILADIEGSTNIVQSGYHEDVNLAASGAIIGVLNEVKSLNERLEIPYYFGGDGATFIVPKSIVKEVLEVLENYRLHLKRIRNFNLKVGSIDIGSIYNQDKEIKIAKLGITPLLTIPIIIGTGLKFAEYGIKSNFTPEINTNEEISLVNLDGMECRWEKIKPPVENNKVLCFLVDFTDDNFNTDIFLDIIEKIDTIFGDFQKRQPITKSSLFLDASSSNIKREMQFKLGKNSFGYFLKHWLLTLIGKVFWSRTKNGKKYFKEVTELSHTMMMDGTLNTMFSGTSTQIESFLNYMNALEHKTNILYGAHITDSSVLSCYVKDMKTDHNHFVDGTKGGYTRAAIMLKKKKQKLVK